jgi:hypothetical protein
MTTKPALCLLSLVILGACGDDNNQPIVPASIASVSATTQSAPVGMPLADSLRVRVTDAAGNPASAQVEWTVVDGGGSISPGTTLTNGNGVAAAEFVLGPTEGAQHAQASVEGLSGSPVVFTATATAGFADVNLSVVSGGNNVPERYGSDLWVHGNYAYTGTWGGFPRSTNDGDVLKVWSLSASGAPSLVDSIKSAGINTVSDVQVSQDGQVLVFSAEYDPEGGVYLYSLADPANPVFRGRVQVPGGVHTATIADIGGGRYVFAARNPGVEEPALLIYDVTDPSDISLIATVPILPFYGIHDTFVRDGIAFVFAWDTGVIILDVGNGIRGGSPSSPVEVSRLETSATGASSPSAHNGWWFHNPVTGEKRYLFVGQEGTGVIGSQASGDIHVLDVLDLANPHEVAFFHLSGAGAHNFWMDEQRQVLYAAFYNAGVIALDVSGTLSGNLSGRLLSRLRPGGAGNTYTWGVQLANGFLYASDMLSGFWQLKVE